MTPARREKAVLSHPRANLKGHFNENGYKRALKTFRGGRSFPPGKRLQPPPAAVKRAFEAGKLSRPLFFAKQKKGAGVVVRNSAFLARPRSLARAWAPPGDQGGARPRRGGA